VVGEGRPALAVLGRSDRRLSEALRLRVPSDVPPGPGGLLGLELEFSVRSMRGGRVHFGSLIHRLALDGTGLDPGDPNAYRCSWGGVITSDGAEAEIATPPVRTRPGFTARLQAWAQTGEAELRRAVPRGIGLDGYSAHFSAAMPAKLNDRVCRLYAETFAADLMLLMDRVDSPGLLVRPRPGRTELCGEFIEGEPLAAAAAFVAGSTRACAAAVRRPGGRAALPPRLDVRLARAVHRYGWYVDRRAFGADLHAASRWAVLPRASGGTICAQSHLELAWAAARQALADDAAPSDLQAADALVTGSLPLPAEQGQPDDAPGGQRGWDAPFPSGDGLLPKTTPLCAHVRRGFTLRPVAATWDFTVFEACGPGRRAYACVPRDSLPGFLAALEEGALDDPIAAYLALTSRRRVLSAPGQTRRPGLYDQMDAPAGLLAAERDPQTGHQEPGERGAKHTLGRPGKQSTHEQGSSKKASRLLPRVAAIGAAIAVALAGAGVVTAVLSHQRSAQNDTPPAPVTFQPSALAFPVTSISMSTARSVTMTNNGSSPAVITGVSITGPGQRDFSVLGPALRDAAYRGGQAIHPAAQTAPCHRRVLHAQTCTITVVFTPSASGSRAADLRIYLSAPLRPRDIALTGTGAGAGNLHNDAVMTSGITTITARGSTTITYTLMASDASKGEPNQCDATLTNPVTVTINAPPAVSAPASLSFTSCGPGNAKTATFSSQSAGTYNITHAIGGGVGGSLFKDQADFTLTVTTRPPNAPPTLTLPPDQTVEATGPGGATVTYTVSASDAKGGTLTPRCSPASGSVFPLGITPVTCSVTDSSNLTVTGSFAVIVQDTTPPSLVLPGDITAEATGPDGAAVTYTATATDLVDGSVPVNCSPASGSTFILDQATPVNCSATDAHHNTATGSFTVTVQDTTPPSLVLPGDITVQAGPNGEAVSYTATATDLVDGSVTPSCTPPSGSTFPVGTTTVTCTATDAHGNTATGSFTITVQDATQPVP
jgi:HYR domain